MVGDPSFFGDHHRSQLRPFRGIWPDPPAGSWIATHEGLSQTDQQEHVLQGPVQRLLLIVRPILKRG